MLTVVGVREQAEPNGSHVLALSDGEAIIPAAQVVHVQRVLQVALANRVLTQARTLDVPTESTLAPIVLRLLQVRPATKGTETNLACNLLEIGWLVFAADDEALRQLRDAAEQVLKDRAASRRLN